MTEPTPKFWEILFALCEGLPRQGPGNRACAVRALGLCGDLPQTPAVLDQLAQEPEMHRTYSDYYAYEFFAVRRDRRRGSLEAARS